MIGIEFCNLLEEDPFGNLQLQPFDAILAPRCLGTLESYDQQERSIQNLCTRYLKPGGYFIILDFADEFEYKIGDKLFHWVNIPADKFKTMCVNASLEVETFYTGVDYSNGIRDPLNSDFDFGSNVVVVGRYLG